MFRDVKVGDSVILRSPYRNRVEKVTRVARTIFYAGGLRFRKDNGYEYGGSTYSITYAKRANEEEIEKICNDEIRKRYYITSKKILTDSYPTLDDIKEIYSILQKYER